MRGIPASFWRSGKTRGTLFRANDLARYPFELCEDIIYSALGSPPNADGRPVDGLGGGASVDSSVFKAAIVGAPGEGLAEGQKSELFLEPEWAENGSREGLGAWDVVLRLAQVETNNVCRGEVHWPKVKCCDLLAACAHDAITGRNPIVTASKMLPYIDTAREALASTNPSKYPKPVNFPVRILSANTEEVLTVRVPVDLRTARVYEPLHTWYDAYVSCGDFDSYGRAGPNAIEVELPLDTAIQLPTGNHMDTISLSGHSIPITIVDAGVSTIILSASSLPQSGSDLEDYLRDQHSLQVRNMEFDSKLHSIFESVHKQVEPLISSTSMRLPSTICIIWDMSSEGSNTLAEKYICCCQADLSALCVSSPGKFDNDIPDPALLALTIAQGLKGSVAYETWIKAQGRSCGGGQKPETLNGEVVRIFVAHPSGVSEASVKMHSDKTGRRAVAALLPRSVRETMRGEVLIPDEVMELEVEEVPSE